MQILAGRYKHRHLLPPPPQAKTRPITSLAKKSVMDTLGGLIDDGVVLDLYCGTGTLGIEALSRGARRCFFADNNADVIDCLRRNIDALEGAAERSVVWQGNVPLRIGQWLTDVSDAVDVAFVDPPYDTVRAWDWNDIARDLLTPLAARLSPNGLIVLRTPGKITVPPGLGGLSTWRQRRYGDMRVTMLELPRPEP
ncbi:MAG: RsmD family RNA methyltransferase [Planctomycetaceae bacterium]|nr:RsmD family RNA methyltransferase [Planctomycetaceae bacterium]